MRVMFWATVLLLRIDVAHADQYELHQGKVTATVWHPFRVVVMESNELVGSLHTGDVPKVDVTVIGLKSGVRSLDGLISGALNLEKFPTIRFQSDEGEMKWGLESGRLRLDGKLYLRGEAKVMEIRVGCRRWNEVIECSWTDTLLLSELPVLVPTLLRIPPRERVLVSANLLFKKGGRNQ